MIQTFQRRMFSTGGFFFWPMFWKIRGKKQELKGVSPYFHSKMEWTSLECSLSEGDNRTVRPWRHGPLWPKSQKGQHPSRPGWKLRFQLEVTIHLTPWGFLFVCLFCFCKLTILSCTVKNYLELGSWLFLNSLWDHCGKWYKEMFLFCQKGKLLIL